MKYFPYTALILLLFVFPVSSGAVPKDWKTLKNKNGWTIQYPKNWMLEEDYDGSYALNPPINGDFDAKDAFSPEICGPSKALKTGEQAGCIQIQSAPGMTNNGKPDLNPESLEKVMRRILSKKNGGVHGHDLKIQGLPTYDATGFLESHSDLLPMRRVIVRTNRGIVDIEYYEIKDNRDNFLPSNKWIYEKTFEDMLSTLQFTENKLNK